MKLTVDVLRKRFAPSQPALQLSVVRPPSADSSQLSEPARCAAVNLAWPSSPVAGVAGACCSVARAVGAVGGTVGGPPISAWDCNEVSPLLSECATTVWAAPASGAIVRDEVAEPVS